MVVSALAVFEVAQGIPSGSSLGLATYASPAIVPGGPASPTVASPPSAGGNLGGHALPSFCSSLESTSTSRGYAEFVHHVRQVATSATGAGLPAADLHLPYAGPVADQTVNGVAMAGSQLSAECGQGAPTTQPADTGVAYDGQTDVRQVRNLTLDANSVDASLTLNSPTQNFYPGSGTPTVWGAQENVVLPNVTLFGQRCPNEPCAANGTGNYAFWIQNVVSYDSFNDSLYFVDDTWNFTNFTSYMESSSLVAWSPTGGNYTGTWVAFSPYYHAPPPFTVNLYVNTSVNPAGDQVLWYNYSLRTPTHFVGDGSYDYLVFHSQPTTGRHLRLLPPEFEASATETHVVNEGYEFDAFIGADDGSNQLVLAANATMRLQYCVQVPYCTSTSFAYANVPAAVNYGSQTGEQAVGVAVNYVGTTAYLSGGPAIAHGLWNFSGQVGVRPGVTKVTNAISVSGDPEGPLASEPYVFVFLENTAFASEGYQWAPDVPAWYLMPGTYRFQLLLADYAEQTGTIVVGSSSTSLRSDLPYTPSAGVYTPLWAFGNGQLAGISSSGSGSVASQYLPFNNPTTARSGYVPGNLSENFYSLNDYYFPSFPGVLLSGTSAYVDLNAPPTFGVTVNGSTSYLGLEFFETSHLTLSHDAFVQGWNAWSEISFYTTVPASQNPVPQGEVYVGNSAHDLILSNDFVATAPFPGAVSPDALVMYGGTDNVVWGNTFTDPSGVGLNVSGPYAGLGLGEGGDLVYNNNFSVDNPVVFLPYNWPNVADCLPQSLGGCANNGHHNAWYYNDAANVVGNTWNVTPQPASDVVHTVNGFPLSGNVLGPAVTTQGGNYWWNYGTAPNNFSSLPYVARFYYSNWSWIYPLGCGSIQAPGAPCGTPPPMVGAYLDGITAGGDYAPYGPTVTFSETGLARGTIWTVSIGGRNLTTGSTSMTVPEPYGNYTYTIFARGWQAQPATGTILASGTVTVPVTFART